mgnify:CR=1 FL=1
MTSKQQRKINEIWECLPKQAEITVTFAMMDLLALPLAALADALSSFNEGSIDAGQLADVMQATHDDLENIRNGFERRLTTSR